MLTYDWTKNGGQVNEGITAVSDVFQRWETRDKLSRVVTVDDVRDEDYNLSPSLFVQSEEPLQHRPLAVVISECEAARKQCQDADARLSELLEILGLAGKNA